MIQENGKLTFCSKRTHPGKYEIYTSAAAANNRKHNDPREWHTHALLKRTHPGNDEIYTSATLRIIENITIQENGKLTPCSKEPIEGMMKYTHQQLLRINEKHNDQREWNTHTLLKRTHPGNYEIYNISSCCE